MERSKRREGKKRRKKWRRRGGREFINLADQSQRNRSKAEWCQPGQWSEDLSSSHCQLFQTPVSDAAWSTVFQRSREMCVFSDRVCVHACYNLHMISPTHVVSHGYYHLHIISAMHFIYHSCMLSPMHTIIHVCKHPYMLPPMYIIIYVYYHPCMLSPSHVIICYCSYMLSSMHVVIHAHTTHAYSHPCSIIYLMLKFL